MTVDELEDKEELNYKGALKTIITNKYVIITLLFVVWMLFLDQNSYLNHRELNKEIDELEQGKAYFENKISVEEKQLYNLKKNHNELEKIARENYMMKKKNEDVFLVVDETIKTLK